MLPMGGHTFILFSSEREESEEKKFIFDPTNPIRRSSGDPTEIVLSPFIAPLSNQEWESYNKTAKGAMVEYLGVKRVYARV